MTVKEIVIEHLKRFSYDGLYNPYESCGCEIDDLMPCDNCGISDCEPGYKSPCDCEDEHDFHIGVQDFGGVKE